MTAAAAATGRETVNLFLLGTGVEFWLAGFVWSNLVVELGQCTAVAPL